MIKEYLYLINSFIKGKISAQEFELLYIDKFENDNRSFLQDVFDILNDLFTACDVYCDNPDLRGEYDIDEKELLNEARLAVKKLAKMGFEL